MTEANGRFKVAPSTAWAIICGILVAGAAYGTLMAQQVSIARDVTEIKTIIRERYYTIREVDDKERAAYARMAEQERRILELEESLHGRSTKTTRR